MLMPKKVKYRKVQRGRKAGKALRGSSVTFGEFGLKALEAHWITSRQIEAARIAMTRYIKSVAVRFGFVFFRISRLQKNLPKPVWEKVKGHPNIG